MLETTISPDGMRVPIAVRMPEAPSITLEVPANLARTKENPLIAQAWQRHVRAAFTQAFERGFVAVGFSREDAARPRYLLHRRT